MHAFTGVLMIFYHFVSLAEELREECLVCTSDFLDVRLLISS